jgi:hypothetical protein
MYLMIPSAAQKHGKEFAGTAASLLSAANSRRRLPRLPEPAGGENAQTLLPVSSARSACKLD